MQWTCRGKPYIFMKKKMYVKFLGMETQKDMRFFLYYAVTNQFNTVFTKCILVLSMYYLLR